VDQDVVINKRNRKELAPSRILHCYEPQVGILWMAKKTEDLLFLILFLLLVRLNLLTRA
jgi:hypothetical protein